MFTTVPQSIPMLSPLTKPTPTTVSYIFRCVACSTADTNVTTANGTISMTAILSELAPIYLNTEGTAANLTIGGPRGFPFVFPVNIDAARSSNYTSFLSIAGLS